MVKNDVKFSREAIDPWRAPMAAMDQEVIYIVDEMKGVLRKYDDLMKVWVDVLNYVKKANH